MIVASSVALMALEPVTLPEALIVAYRYASAVVSMMSNSFSVVISTWPSFAFA